MEVGEPSRKEPESEGAGTRAPAVAATAPGGDEEGERREYGRLQWAGLVLGPALFLGVLLIPAVAPEGSAGGAFTRPARGAAATGLLMATWWLTEAIPIPATSLIPLVLFPFLGVLPMEKTAAAYASHFVFLLIGGFLIGIAMQRWGLHRRVALGVVRLIGTSPHRIVLGFMVATAFVSLWISNTATAMMMTPIGLAVLVQVRDSGTDRAVLRPFGMALMLGIAYASSVGGIGTLIGTFPNVVLAEQVKRLVAGAPEVTFVRWFLVGFPTTAILIPVIWLILTRPVPKQLGAAGAVERVIEGEVARLGRWSRGEVVVAIVFGATALAWVTGAFWSKLSLFGYPLRGVNDSVVAVAAALFLFICPLDRRGTFVLDWKHGQKLPWGLLLLMGGGFALADGISQPAGLAGWIAWRLGGLPGEHPVMFVALICTIVTFLTEVTSNTATAQIMLPVIAPTAVALGIDPIGPMIAAAMSASFAFMLPVGTPPNAIAFGSGYVDLPKMARTGFLLNLIGIVLVTAVVMVVVPRVFG